MPAAEKEIAELERQRVSAFNEGNLDAWMAMYTENAVHTAATMPFWIEGKDAIRAECADLFHTYPMRRVVVQQPSIRVYNADTIAVTNSYLHIALVDRAGHAEHADLRCSQTWVKQGQQWRLVDVHVSRLPVSS
jgi:uncharacterized protein (TIGR02246 family)